MIHTSNKHFNLIAPPAGEWGVLTCHDVATLRLADVLASAGYQAWAPKESLPKRLGRSRSRDATHRPIMAGFVFVPSAHIWRLAEMAYGPSRQFQIWDEAKGRMVGASCPFFSIMRQEHDGQPSRVKDHALNPLRMRERYVRPAEEIALFEQGDTVFYPAAGFEGLPGVVTVSKKKYTFVDFPGKRDAVKVPTALLIAESAS